MWWWLAAIVAWVAFVFFAVKPRLPTSKKPSLTFTFILLGGMVSLSVSFFMLRAMYASGSVVTYRVCPTTVGERLAVVKRFGRGKADQRIDWLDTATGKRVAASAVPDGARFAGQTGDFVWMKTPEGLVAWSAVTGRRNSVTDTPIPDPAAPTIARNAAWPKPLVGELVGIVPLHRGFALLYSDQRQDRSEVDAVDATGRLLWRY